MLQVISKFQATVYGNTTNSPTIYDIVNFLHDAMLENEHNVFFDDEKQPKINMSEFMADLMSCIERYYYKSEFFTQFEVETGLQSCISNCENFTDLGFSIDGCDWCFKYINEKIKNGEYN